MKAIMVAVVAALAMCVQSAPAGDWSSAGQKFAEGVRNAAESAGRCAREAGRGASDGWKGRESSGGGCYNSGRLPSSFVSGAAREVFKRK